MQLYSPLKPFNLCSPQHSPFHHVCVHVCVRTGKCQLCCIEHSSSKKLPRNRSTEPKRWKTLFGWMERASIDLVRFLAINRIPLIFCALLPSKTMIRLKNLLTSRRWWWWCRRFSLFDWKEINAYVRSTTTTTITTTRKNNLILQLPRKNDNNRSLMRLVVCLFVSLESNENFRWIMRRIIFPGMAIWRRFVIWIRTYVGLRSSQWKLPLFIFAWLRSSSGEEKVDFRRPSEPL